MDKIRNEQMLQRVGKERISQKILFVDEADE